MIRTLLTLISGVLLLLACATETENLHDPDMLLAVNQSIEEELTRFAHDNGSIRTVVRQFHEGETDFLGNAEIVISEQYVHEETGFVSQVKQERMKDNPINWYQQTISEMWTDDGLSCYTFLTADLDNTQIKTLLELHRIQQIAGCPMVDRETGAPMGILSASFLEPLDSKQNVPMLRDLEASAKKVEQLLGSKRGPRH